MRRTAYVLVVLVLMASLVGGCALVSEVDRLVARIHAENPGVAILPRDEDGDRFADVFVKRYPDGREEIIEESRAALKQAQLQDQAVVNLLTVAATLVPTLGIGGLGAWWLRRRPVQQLAVATGITSDLIHSVQAVLTDPQVTSEDAAKIKAILDRYQQPETKATVSAEKARLKLSPASEPLKKAS